LHHLASRLVLATASFACLAAASEAEAAPAFTLFESGQVRPLALSPNGKLLFACNSPDNRIEIFRVKKHGLVHRASIPVGLEPVAVAARSNSEIWVVNHLSDSVSIVKLSHGAHDGRVIRTLLVGDEPRDIVFAGPGKDRAFITTAHRGQNIPFDPQLTTPGVGRADVWVFNAESLGASLTGEPIHIIPLFTDTPRALATSPDGSKVYAAGFHSGNQTTVLQEALVPDGFGPGGLPGPSTNWEGFQVPEQGLLVKHDGTHWVDILGRNWDDYVKFHLPDKDVFVIDAMASPPQQLTDSAGYYQHVGTILFNMVVNPVNGKVYVSNSDALNDTRFEGPGIFAGESLRGHLHESRITVLGPASSVAPRHLNKHINYGACCAPLPNAESEKSLAQPTGMAITSNGSTLYVAALGSSKVGVFNTAQIENDTFVPSQANQIEITGGGPTGLVLDKKEKRLFVLTRFDNSISIVDTDAKTETGHVAMHNPEPASIKDGRQFLYDARTSSSHGDSSCASCHIFGDFDSLQWDLGNPDDSVFDNLNPVTDPPLINLITGQPIIDPVFHPMKGPMATQSLRGMDNHGPMHWRGDRTGANEAPNIQPDSGAYDERAAFKKFQVGFTDLLGRSEFIADADMEKFTDFILQVMMPPNPIRNLDNSLTPDQAIGMEAFFNEPVEANGTCVECHALNPDGNAEFGVEHPGFFAANGEMQFSFESQLFKSPQLRASYQKVGMFGFPQSFIVNVRDHEHKGDQIRGLGFTHDGSIDSVFRFLSALGFSPITGGGIPDSPEGDLLRRQLESFVMAFPSNLAPIVGQQVTLTHDNALVAGPRIDLLIARANAGECDLIAKALDSHDEAGFLYIGSGLFASNRQLEPNLSDASLRAFAASEQLGREVTYTCTPPGSGVRLAIDRDADGFLDGDEEDDGSDPADPASTPD
jgi:DNA-binding beta-propeller fold protein YncE